MCSVLKYILHQGGIRDWACASSSHKQQTRNRLKPVQTGRFHLGLVFSRWRREKFGLTSRPWRRAIGRSVAKHVLTGDPLDEAHVNQSQLYRAPTRPLRPIREKEGKLRPEWICNLR